MKQISRKLENIFIVILSHCSVKLASKYLFLRSQKYRLNLKNSKAFNEKLMWLKLYNYNKNETVWKCSDKYGVREYAKSKGIEDKNLPKLLKVYDSASQINFKELPNKFALKCSHGCGFNIICKNKKELDEKEVRKKMNRWMHRKFGYGTAEIHYTHIKPKILCEEYMESESNDLPYDYKIYCFNGNPKLIMVCSEREKKLKLNFFDLNWQEQDIGKKENRNQKNIKKPEHLQDMIKIARILSDEFPFVRVDFYEYNNRAILGEMTFTPAACLANYYSKEGQEYLGNLIKITKMNEKGVK